MERKTAKSLIVKNEKSLRHNNFWDCGLLIANTISNPHPSATWVHLLIHNRSIIPASDGKIKAFPPIPADVLPIPEPAPFF